jgi:Uma2 family endonuclease
VATQEEEMNLPPSLVQLLNAPPEEAPPPPKYPSSDGKPMADNSRQTHWIILLYCNLCWLFRSRQDVAVHANMFWYVEEDDPTQKQAPDVMVIFGRPPGQRESYLQWREENVAVTVAVEIVSPSNSYAEMAEKQEFYDHYGVEEYYEYDPQTNRLIGFRRQGEVWVRIRDFAAWSSPRLGVRFVLSRENLTVETLDGQPFLPFEEVAQRWRDEKRRADDEKQRADAAERRVQRLVELGRKARRGQATPEEIEELERLESEGTAQP